MRTYSPDACEAFLIKFLKVLLPESVATINILYIPEGKNGLVDYYFTVAFVLKKNHKRIDMDFFVSEYGQISFENEPQSVVMLDNGGDMTEFWKFLFFQLLKQDGK